MSISSPSTIKERIQSATERSKIALFRDSVDCISCINAVFDDTYSTKQRIKNNDSDYLGSFYGAVGAIDAMKVIRMAHK